MKGQATRGSTISFGEYGLKALEPSWVSNKQIESARVAITRHVKRLGKLWIRVFPDKPITKKPAETRMGKGKGPPEGWVAVVKPGRILFELEGVSLELAREAMALASSKLPLKTKFVTRSMTEGKAVKAHEMREMTEDELEQQHDSMVEELVNLRIKLAVKQLDNPLRVRYLRKELARVKTVLREKRLGAKPGEILDTKKAKKS